MPREQDKEVDLGTAKVEVLRTGPGVVNLQPHPVQSLMTSTCDKLVD